MLTICDHPLICHRLDHMRDKATPPSEFRHHLREIAMMLIYEASRDLLLEKIEIATPLENIQGQRLAGPEQVLVSILRAGNGFLDGALAMLPHARVGFLGIYRDEKTLEPVDYYANLPPHLATAPIFLLDPMLATGNSALNAIEYVKKSGGRDIRLVTLVSAPEGVKRIEEADADIPIYTAALDRGLNDVGFILPGLGDAGDRIFNSG